MGELKLFGGSNICYYSFIISIFSETATTQKSEVFFFVNFFRKCECIRNCYLVTSSNLLKKSVRKTSLFVLTKTAVMEKVFC